MIHQKFIQFITPFVFLIGGNLATQSLAAPIALGTTELQKYTDRFGEEDRWYFQVSSDAAVSQVNNGVYGGQYIKNSEAFSWLKDNVPLLDVPDTTLMRTYYFRWWTFRKHIKNIGTAQTPHFVFTEFIDPVGWSDGSSNSIAAPLGHHIYEGRWLLNQKIVKDYETYWLTSSIANPRRYSSWLADAVLASFKIHGDTAHAMELLLSSSNRLNLAKNWNGWLSAQNAPGGEAQVAYFNNAIHLFWQNTDRDAMENSLTGDGYKPSLNAYLYGDAIATAQLFKMAAKADPANAAAHLRNAEKFDSTAKLLKLAVQERSWDPEKNFFMNGSYDNGTFSRASKREEVGFTPWFFGLPDDGGAVDYGKAWQNTITSSTVFKSPFGIVSGAQNEPGFNPGTEGNCCRWDGPIWPYSTSITLKAFANLLNSYHQTYVNKMDYFQTLSTFAASHQNTLSRGGQTRTLSWIDESMAAASGRWVHILFDNDVLKPRGYAYNHSTFNDLILSDLIGLHPRLDDTIEVNPLTPDAWKSFAIDNVAYHGKTLAVIWDEDGKKYGKGQGLNIFVDGKLAGHSASLRRLTVHLNAEATVPVAVKNLSTGLEIKSFRNQLLVHIPGDGAYRAQLIGTQGKIMLETSGKAQGWFPLSTTGLRPGLYSLRITSTSAVTMRMVTLF